MKSNYFTQLENIIHEDDFQLKNNTLSTNILYESRVRLFDLLHAAKFELSNTDFCELKKLSIEFMCESFGCSIDADVLHQNSGDIFTDSELIHIIQNSALNRWF